MGLGGNSAAKERNSVKTAVELENCGVLAPFLGLPRDMIRIVHTFFFFFFALASRIPHLEVL